MTKIILNQIEVNYWEDRSLSDKGEPFKRSEQFREIVKVVNENAKTTEEWLNKLKDNQHQEGGD